MLPIPEEEPIIPDIFTDPEYGLLKKAPGLRDLAAIKDTMDEYHRRRHLYHLRLFFEYLDDLTQDENAREKFQERFNAHENKAEFVEILQDFLNDREARTKLPILAKLFHEVVEGKLSIDKFYDLTFILDRLNTRSLRFLKEMGNSGFEVLGDIEEYVDDGAILIAAGVCLREPNRLTITPLGRELYNYLGK